jgi:hypothetical protein
MRTMLLEKGVKLSGENKLIRLLECDTICRDKFIFDKNSYVLLLRQRGIASDAKLFKYVTYTLGFIYVHFTRTTSFMSMLDSIRILYKTSFLVSWGGVRRSSLGTSAAIWPIVPAPGDR